MSEFSDCKGTTDSFPDYIPSQLSKDKRMEGREIKGKNARKHVTGHALPQSSVPDRLLTIVVLIAAVIIKLPLGAQQAEEVTENPAMQQLSGLVKQLHAVKSTMEELKSDVKKNSEKHRKQASKLNEIDTNINKINDILNPSNPKGMSYPDIKIKVDKIGESIAESHKDIVDTKDAVEKYHAALKGSMEDIRRNLSTSITEEEEIFDYYLTKNKSKILKDVIANIELAAETLKSEYKTTYSKAEAIERELNKADIQKVQENAKHAKKMADEANVKLKTVEQHLFNKDALTAAILILFFLIIGLMLNVLKLKSSLESALAGGSTYRPLKVSREMEDVLQKMPYRPTLDNAVCIVSFDASNSDEYKRIINETLGQFGGVSLRTHVIRKHADITELPNCRMYIMCVEFTKRHVIIEKQGLGLGDLNLTLYRGVRKLSGALVILYVHDPGSRNLTDDQLYSDGIYCVKKQPELKELCEKDRFISAHKKLNTAQKKALETAIGNVLNIQAASY
ncbi:hypothetical protein MAR_020061 [Mya arenaria]|uniref:Uncharacterized protein n=1 Tax=Mya arenaria TaxID=6604 RepID=A0ABY7E7D4_MYAAR|nr:hypothetical protein MAR_020061 [Mya arenaria]